MYEPDQVAEEEIRDTERAEKIGEYGPTETHYQAVVEPEEDENPCASLSARFGAFVIDLIGIAYLCMIVYRLFGDRLHLSFAELDQWRSVPNLTLYAVVIIVSFLYFFLFEGVFARTPGKMLCGLAVADRSGEAPGLIGVLIRNLLRYVDFILFPLTGLGFAEVTAKSQRLGDILGGTTVRRTTRPGHAVMPPNEVVWGSITRRTIALLLDLAVFGLCALFFLLTLPTQRETLTFIILQAGPVLVIAYWVLCDVALGGTPVKLLLGLRVVDEHARPVGVAGSLLRNLFRILDHNPLGYLCAILSARKQRPGDLAAQSGVVKTGWSVRSLLSLMIFVLLVSGITYYGIHNPNNFVRTEQVITVGPWTLPDVPSHLKYLLGMRLRIISFHFGQTARPALAEEPVYSPGEIVYLSAVVQGYMKEQGIAWFQEDILVNSPDGTPLIDLLNTINKRVDVGDRRQVSLESSFLLPLSIATGQYHVRIRIRDRYGNMFGEAQKTFLVQ